MLKSDSTALTYDANQKSWGYNSDVCYQLPNHCPKTYVQRKLQSLSRDNQKILMAAACLGSSISERLLEVALQEPVRKRFQELVNKGRLSYHPSRQTYSFRENAFQSSCYDLISEELKPAFHLEIGRRLWKHLTKKELDQSLFLVLNQLQQGVHLIREQTDCHEVAVLCLTAAEKAAALYSFPTASSYLRLAFDLLGPKNWEDAYDLSLVLYNYAAEVEFTQGDSDRVDFLIDEVLRKGRCFDDKIRAYTTRIYVLGARRKLDEARDLSIACLHGLGVTFDPQYQKVNLLWSWARIARKLRGKSDQRLKRLPIMEDPSKLAAIQILNMLLLTSKIGQKELFPFVVLKMMKLTLFHGISGLSSVAFAGYGSLLCYTGRVEEGIRLGKLALQLVEELKAQSYFARVCVLVWGIIYVNIRPMDDSLDHLKKGHRLGLQTGDVECATLNVHLYMLFMFVTGKFPISSMLFQLSEFRDLTALHGHATQVRSKYECSFLFFSFGPLTVVMYHSVPCTQCFGRCIEDAFRFEY